MYISQLMESAAEGDLLAIEEHCRVVEILAEKKKKRPRPYIKKKKIEQEPEGRGRH